MLNWKLTIINIFISLFFYFDYFYKKIESQNILNILHNIIYVIINKMAFSAFLTVNRLYGDDIIDDIIDDMNDNSYDDGLYVPDFTLTRRPVKHTTTRCTGYAYEQPVLTIKRPDATIQHIPITEIDKLLGFSHISYRDNDVSLGKRNMFHTIQDALDIHATSMKKIFNVSTNMDIREFTVPIIGYLDNRSSTSDIIGTDCEYFKANRRYNKRGSVDDTHDGSHDIPRERSIIIDGNTYSIRKVYKRFGGRFIALNIPSDYNRNFAHHLGENEQTFRVSKITPSKTSIIITLPKETELSALSVHPEDMQFEMIHSTTIRCHNNCTKKKHCISCLKNDPGYLITFKLLIRSSITDGYWISLGTFAGNNSIYDSTRISFDTMVVKEIKIVPVNYHKSFDKVGLTPIGPSISSAPTSVETFVTYILKTPRDGKYFHEFDKVIDKYGRRRFRCRCSLCTGRGKGRYKEKCQFMRDACDI